MKLHPLRMKQDQVEGTGKEMRLKLPPMTDGVETILFSRFQI